MDIFLKQQEFHNSSDQIEIINFICEKFDTSLYKIKNWIKQLNLEKIEEAKKIRTFLKYNCWEFIQAIQINEFTNDIELFKKIREELKTAKVEENLSSSFGNNENRKYITFKISHAFLKYCYEHTTETIPQEKFLEFCDM